MLCPATNQPPRALTATLLVAATFLALSGCSQPRDDADATEALAEQAVTIEPVDEINFSATECYGTCPAFTIVVEDSGQGHFEGKAYVARFGSHDFDASSKQFADFAQRLAPFRPAGEKAYLDGPCITDAPSVLVSWTTGGRTDTLRWNLGCHTPWPVEQNLALYRAWEILPVEDLVGSDDERVSYGRRDR